MLILFYAVLSIPVIGPPIVALAAIGLTLGGSGGSRELTAKERRRAIERNKAAKAKWAATEGKEYAAALAELKGKRQ